MGAYGVLVPFVDSREDALRTVHDARYPPIGRRSRGGLRAPLAFATDPVTYGRAANDATLLAVQIETVRALDALAEIAAVDGIDVLFVGPGDLAESMGVWPPQMDAMTPAYAAAIARVPQVAREHGKAAGFWSTIPRSRAAASTLATRSWASAASRRCFKAPPTPSRERWGCRAGDGSDAATGTDAHPGAARRRSRVCAQAREHRDSHRGRPRDVYPRDYRDWREPVPIGQIVRDALARDAARDGPESAETIAVGTVTSVREFRGRVSIVTAQLEDATGSLKAAWFRPAWLRGTAGGRRSRIRLRPRRAQAAAQRGRRRSEMNVLHHRMLADGEEYRGRIVPVYRASKEVPSPRSPA